MSTEGGIEERERERERERKKEREWTEKKNLSLCPTGTLDEYAGSGEHAQRQLASKKVIFALVHPLILVKKEAKKDIKNIGRERERGKESTSFASCT